MHATEMYSGELDFLYKKLHYTTLVNIQTTDGRVNIWVGRLLFLFQ